MQGMGMNGGGEEEETEDGVREKKEKSFDDLFAGQQQQTEMSLPRSGVKGMEGHFFRFFSVRALETGGKGDSSRGRKKERRPATTWRYANAVVVN